MRLWIDHAHQSLVGPRSGSDSVCVDVVRTFQTMEQFFAVLVCGPDGSDEGKATATRVADRAAFALRQGTSLDTVVQIVLAALPNGEHMPFSILQVLGGCQARLVECDAPPLFLTRGGHLVMLPVLEDVSHGRLVRKCRVLLQDGDHMAMVSEGFMRTREGSQRWGWGGVAVSTRRWTDTGCNAEQLLSALIQTYRRLAEGEPEQDVTAIAMHVRPLRSATVWTGPPADPASDRVALERLLAEPGQRVICGDTTAQIAARLLEMPLEIESRPPEGWSEIPPTAQLEGVHLVTEGLITLSRTTERLADAVGASALPRTEDGATQLAHTLLAADSIHFVVGLAVNPEQGDDATMPPRQAVVEGLLGDLKARGKVVSVEYF